MAALFGMHAFIPRTLILFDIGLMGINNQVCTRSCKKLSKVEKSIFRLGQIRLEVRLDIRYCSPRLPCYLIGSTNQMCIRIYGGVREEIAVKFTGIAHVNSTRKEPIAAIQVKIGNSDPGNRHQF